ncbi:hypothetical protein D3C76_657590 [compost metagenome]
MRGHRGHQLAELADRRVAVLAKPGLAGNHLAQYLGLAQQLVEQRHLAQQRSLALSGLEGIEHLAALVVEGLGLGLVTGHCNQAGQAALHLLLDAGDLRLDVLGLARLAKHGVDLHQVAEGFHIAAQGQAAAEQFQALQLGAGGMELRIGIADQVVVGHQHGQEKQNTDQAELHAEAQAVHQRDGRIQQALQGWCPPILIVFTVPAFAPSSVGAGLPRDCGLRPHSGTRPPNVFSNTCIAHIGSGVCNLRLTASGATNGRSAMGFSRALSTGRNRRTRALPSAAATPTDCPARAGRRGPPKCWRAGHPRRGRPSRSGRRR